YEEEGWRRRKDGSRFWASVIVTPLRDAEGRLVGYAKVTRDLSRQRLEAIRQGLEARWHRMADALPI
ncbi:MAG: PAS domain S-box protein, partial [Gammaproteobacteria bacterium]|nr:PAS domain S-box protein [Gemmatimonadota bacterium]NIR41042.1 PAS domain S-box protein [Actinomycetota bacterium]NIU79122.1 PAS domain S-box protein [Gammaproteobacteria bacterium]NIX24705.1 PAS domain S-box protein [Actinomycetota bacterium]